MAWTYNVKEVIHISLKKLTKGVFVGLVKNDVMDDPYEMTHTQRYVLLSYLLSKKSLSNQLIL